MPFPPACAFPGNQGDSVRRQAMNDPNIQPLFDAKGQPYFPAVAPALRKVLVGIFIAVAILSAGGVYLASITFLGFLSRAEHKDYQNQFYFWMFLLHIAVGILFILPFVVFGALHMRTAI